ncbi:MAG: TonB-dependent receptor plug domain-containing protein [bacterium]|nr:TonB-dependent receptor plug domain-containing protein [bacterium]
MAAKQVQTTVIFFVFIMLCFPFSLPGDEKGIEEDIVDISLEDLLSIEVTVASKKATTIRESPGIITLITADEIKNSGARDLIDVLRMVPGFNFGVDVQNTVGVAVRGNWAHEGKVLLMIDNQEFNELAFATLQFGNHFPLDHIQRIEIIRGPGSAIYGGFAELGVINIITKKAEQINGVAVNGTYGQMKDTYARRTVSLMVGKKMGDLSLNAHIFAGQGNRSDRDFSDFYGDTYNMKDNNNLDPTFVNLNLKYRAFNVRLIMDQYRTKERDVFFVNAPEAYDTNFDSYFFEIKNEFKCGKNFTVTPRINYRKQRAYYTPGTTAMLLEELDPDSYGGLFSQQNMSRLLLNVTIAYDFSSKANIIGGFESYRDKAVDEVDTSFFGKDRLSYHNLTFFGQAFWNTSIGNITVGARYEDHNEFGTSFVPRFGLTKVLNKLHFKFLFSKAFRTPSISNIVNFVNKDGDPDARIKPENTSVIEIEAGYQLSKKLFVTANLFDIKIKDPIVYFYESQDAYDNYEKTGTRGFEMELKLKDKWGYASLTYSFYKVNDNQVDQYDVEADKDVLLGFPAHKLTLNGSVKLSRNLTLSPSLVYISHRYGYTAVDADDNLIMDRFDPVLWLNVYLRCKNLFVKGLEAGIGVYNLTDEKYSFIQPYMDGYHAPFPGPSREIVMRLGYSFNFK